MNTEHAQLLIDAGIKMLVAANNQLAVYQHGFIRKEIGDAAVEMLTAIKIAEPDKVLPNMPHLHKYFLEKLT